MALATMGGVEFRNKATGWGYALVACYFVAFVVTVVQIALIAVRGARIKSFHGAFLVLTSLWLPLRVLVLVLTPENADDDTGLDTIEVLYYLPTVLQVCASRVCAPRQAAAPPTAGSCAACH